MGILSLLMPLFFLACALSADVDPAFPFTENLDAANSVQLRWGFDLVKDTIFFELTMRTTGWVGFGFSPNGGMAGADIIIGGVGTGGIYFRDSAGVGNTLPLLDYKQDYILLSLTETDGQTVMKFQRSISTCDENDFPIKEGPIKLIYAYGQTDDISYHRSQRGTKEVNLLKYMPRVTLPDSKYFDLTMTHFTVPAQNTYYHCKLMRLPDLGQKIHVYRVEPLIENVDLVHHMLLYRCPPLVTTPYENACYTQQDQTECYQAVAAWGVGGGAFELPEVAGIPMGGDGAGILYRLEIHYNNQNKTPDRMDNSGLRFHYTANLRQYDAAVLQTGLVVAPGYAIPPNASTFLTYGLCDTSSISQIITGPVQDMQVFAVILHTHLVGRKVRVGHFRNGVQIDFLVVNEHYNFEFQEAVNLGKTKAVKMGDKLLVECTYDTDNRTELTWGGLSTINEMCLAFLFYYPAMDISSCSSFPNTRALSTEMGAANEIDWKIKMQEKKWDEKSIAQYQQLLNRVQQTTLVISSANNISFNTATIPELRSPPPVSCKRNGAEITCPTTGMVLTLLTSVLLTFT